MAAPLHAAAAGVAVAAGAGVPLAVTPLVEAEGLPNTPLAGLVHVHVLAPRFPEQTSVVSSRRRRHSNSAVLTDHVIVHYQITLFAPFLSNFVTFNSIVLFFFTLTFC